jgi:ferredoxin-thioredoxin reductase catalytic subunit
MLIDNIEYNDMELNPNEKIVNAIRKMLIKTNGYCPCNQGNTPKEDTKCPCKKMTEKHQCCCTLYTKKES